MVAETAQVEEKLSARDWPCPVSGCSGRLGPWGWARPRWVFFDFEERLGEGTKFLPRRARCVSCGVTQVLLDQRLLSRRRDSSAVIQLALELMAKGWGVGKVALWVGRPFSTVRGWLRAAKRCVDAAEPFLAALGQVVAPAAPMPSTAVSEVGRLVSAGKRFAAGAGWPEKQWLAGAASGCRCCLLQVSWWAQHESAVAGIAVGLASSRASP